MHSVRDHFFVRIRVYKKRDKSHIARQAMISVLRPDQKEFRRWLDKINAYLEEVSAHVEDTHDRVKWRNKIATLNLSPESRGVVKKQ